MPKPAAGIMTWVMDLGVIVLSYNHPEITARTLTSALRFFEDITLVHNGSEKKFIQLLQHQFPQVKHLILNKNKGFSGGANAGLQFVFQTHTWAFFITNDCEIMKIGSLNHKPCIIAPQIRIRKSQKIDSMGGLFWPEKAELKHCRTLQEFQNSKAYKYVPGSSFLLHKDVFISTKGFDERLGTYWEDVDFSIRAQKSGFELKVDSEWILSHAMGKTCRKLSLYTIYFFNRNKKIISEKYTQVWKRPLLYTHLLKHNLKTANQLLKNNRWEDLKSLANAWTDKLD